MGSDISRYMILAFFIILASCSSKQRFKTLSLNPEKSVTVNIDKRIRVKAIDGVRYDFSSEKPYPVMMQAGTRTIIIYFETEYKKGRTFRTRPVSFSIELTKGLKYYLFASDYKDREKSNKNSRKNETFLVHYHLRSDDGTIQNYKASCNIDRLDLSTIKCLINNKENLDRRYGSNRDIAIIHNVVMNNKKECLTLLLKAGADPNRKTRAKEYSPLHYAVSFKRPKLIRILVENKADLNIRDKKGQTPLHTAILNGYYDIAQYLLKNGAKPDLKDKGGLNAYDYSKRSKNKKIRSLLKRKKIKAKALKVKKITRKSILTVKKKSNRSVKKVRKKKAVKRKPKYEEDRLPKRENPIPALKCKTQECYASISDKIESALRKKRYSKLETSDLKKVAYIYFQISKLCKRSAPDSAKEEFSKASELFRSMTFGKRKLYYTRRQIIKKAERHVTNAAKFIVEDAEEKLKTLAK